jgi:hypothetical protein
MLRPRQLLRRRLRLHRRPKRHRRLRLHPRQKPLRRLKLHRRQKPLRRQLAQASKLPSLTLQRLAPHRPTSFARSREASQTTASGKERKKATNLLSWLFCFDLSCRISLTRHNESCI